MKNLLFLLLITGIPLSGISQKSYLKEIKKYRKAEKKHFKNPEESPLREEAKSFPGHNYFPVDPKYRIETAIIPPETPREVEFATSSEKVKLYHVFGYADFLIDGAECRLTLFQREGMDYIFLPFKDYTTGEETYGGGRYLEFPVPDGDSVVIDFNKAFNPYCAYSTGWSCPIVPPENFLDVHIRAGVIGLKSGGH